MKDFDFIVVGPATGKPYKVQDRECYFFVFEFGGDLVEVSAKSDTTWMTTVTKYYPKVNNEAAK